MHRTLRVGLLLALLPAAGGCIKGDELPPVTGSAPVVVDGPTQKVSLDTNRVPAVESCAPGLFVRRTATGWECTQAPATPWHDIPGRPDAFAPQAHRHEVADVDGAAARADLDLVTARTAALEARSELLDQEFVNRAANGSFEAVGADNLPLRWEKTGTGQANLTVQNSGASSGARALSFSDTDANGYCAVRQVLVADAARAALLSGRVFTASALARRIGGSAAGEICIRDSATSKTCAGLAVAASYARAVVRHVVSGTPEFLEVTLSPAKLPEETAAYLFDDVMVTAGSAAPAFTASPADRFAADGTSLVLEDNNVFAIRSGGVTTAKLADRSVTAAKVDGAGAAPGQALVAGAGGTAAWGSLPWSSVSSVPAGFADGLDNDTQYTAGAGLVLSGNQFSVAQNATLVAPTINTATLNSPTLNSATLHSPTINSATLHSPAINSATLASPTINSATLNSPAINSATLVAPTINSATLNSPVLASAALDNPQVTGTLRARAVEATTLATSGSARVGGDLEVAGTFRNGGDEWGGSGASHYAISHHWMNVSSLDCGSHPTGYVKLVTPIVHNESNMFSIKITGYGYGAGFNGEMRCGGYAYDSGTLMAHGCSGWGIDLPFAVVKETRQGREVVVIRIGSPGSSWYYQHFKWDYVGWVSHKPSDFQWVCGETT